VNTTLLGAISIATFFLGAFFAGAETAIIAADRVKIRHLASRGNRAAGEVLELFKDPGYFLSLVLVGTNLGEIACATTFTAVVVQAGHGTATATAILVPTLLIFGEIIPKGIFLYYADRAAVLSVYPLRFFGVILYPVVKMFSASSSGLMRLSRSGTVDPRTQMTTEELLFHLKDSGDAGLITGETLALASKAFEFLELRARDVMTPIRNVVTVEEGLDIEEYEKIFYEKRFTRLPVIRLSTDEVLGILSVQSLLKARGPQGRPPDLEDPYEVSTETPVSEMLVRMRNQGGHMAMVRDADGRLVGMATLEDVLERLVGTMSDEFH
jgi:CBS domain containing-hemolysin-like protein